MRSFSVVIACAYYCNFHTRQCRIYGHFCDFWGCRRARCRHGHAESKRAAPRAPPCLPLRAARRRSAAGRALLAAANGAGGSIASRKSLVRSRVPALRISAPKGSLVLLVVLDYPPNYQYETDWYQKKTYITADDFFEWKWYNHCYCKD